MRVSLLISSFALLVAAAFGPPSFAADTTLNIVLPEEPPTLDACELNDSSISRIIEGNVVQSLDERDPTTGKVVPLLATAWKQAAPTVWEFTLRQGVKFHDGTPFNAQAAVASLNRAFIAKLSCSGALDYFGSATPKFEAVDDYTLRVTTTSPDPILPLRISPLGISAPSTETDRQTETPVGTSPFKFVRWDHGDKIVLKRFDGYWGTAPQASGATYTFRDQDQVRVDMIGTGEADLTVGLTPQYAKNPGAVIFPLSEAVLLRMDARGAPPFNDIRVREAITHALDRQGIINALWNGAGAEASQPVSPAVDGYDPDIPIPAYDPALATKMIADAKAAGIDVSKPVTIANRPEIFENGDQLGQAVAEQLNAIGLNVTVQTLSAAAWTEVLKSHPTDRPGLLLESHSNSLGDASPTVHSRFSSDQGRSQIPDSDKAQVDALIAKGDAASGDARTKAFQNVFAYVAKNVVQDATIAYPEGVMMLGPKVHYKPNLLTGDVIQLSDVTKDQ